MQFFLLECVCVGRGEDNVHYGKCANGEYQNPSRCCILLLLAKANETLEEVKRAEVMVNMTKQAAETAVMRAMEADQRAKNASVRMDQLIQVMVDSVVTFTLYRTNFRLAENGTVQHFRSVDRELWTAKRLNFRTVKVNRCEQNT